jgi:hypothetical protein
MIMNESHYVGHELQFQTYGADIKAFARFLGKFTSSGLRRRVEERLITVSVKGRKTRKKTVQYNPESHNEKHQIWK